MTIVFQEKIKTGGATVYRNNIVGVEQVLLSSFLYDNKKIKQYPELSEDDFFSIAHKKIYKIMKDFSKQKKALDEHLLRIELTDDFDEELLMIMTANFPNDISNHVKQIKKNRYKRELELLLKSSILKISNSDIEPSIVKTEIENFLQSGKYYAESPLLSPRSSKEIKSQAPEFYLEDFCPIQKYETTLFTARGGVGKSFTILRILMQLSLNGIKALGWFSEDSLSNTKHRMEVLKKNNKDIKDVELSLLGKESRPAPFIQYGNKKQFEPSSFFYEFTQAAENYDVVVLDPLDSFIAFDENSNTEARYLINMLNEWVEKKKKTLLLVHHHNKNGDARGASAFINAVRLHYEVLQDCKHPQNRIIQTKKANHVQNKKEFTIELFQKNDEHINEEVDNKDSNFVSILKNGVETNVDEIEGAHDYILIDDEIEVTERMKLCLKN